MTGRLRLQATVRDSAVARFPHARAGSRVMRAFPAFPWRIPDEEIGALRSFFEETSDLRDPDVVEARYRERGLTVVAEPTGADVPQLIIDALEDQRPFSVVRIGDGEANILTYGMYPGTPALDDWSISRIVRLHDGFRLDDPWQVALRSMMHGSILAADVVGVRGLWRSLRGPDLPPAQWLERMIERIGLEPAATRGIVGNWRAREYLVRLAESSFLDGKTIASAHLYLGILKHLGSILPAAERLVCITNQSAAVDIISRWFPSMPIRTIGVGSTEHLTYAQLLRPTPPQRSKASRIMSRVSRELTDDLRGALVLVGAGPWSEFYATWIKERGGVAVDIGSAFDLLVGMKSRPVHQRSEIQELMDDVLNETQR